ncbi:uncharacterized protein LOC129771435 [Toxorhynchites rutilus septentrionalis]|uniref:uncharacterized protein LOC129771435 n=1 Tax=Toxorhynchites rutilus septentrionalis TaxID=329112 RepID=UPI002479D204|nr:uncharacterized protein LOC129771435 [Toxorhynchites rutilus septentrionalis]
MIKIFVLLFALAVITRAFPADQPQQFEGANHPVNDLITDSSQSGAPQEKDQYDSSVTESDEKKEGLQNAETFGFGYYHSYPRYYGYYPRYYGFYPRYYSYYW